MALENNKSIVRLDSVKAASKGHIYSLQSAEEVQNGQVGVAGNLLNGEREVRSFDAPSDLAKNRAVLVAQPEIVANEASRAYNNLKNFSIPAGKVFRAYELHEDDMFSVSDDAIKALDAEAGVVVGNNVVLAAGSHQLTEVAPAGAAEHAFVGRIEAIESIGRSYVVGAPGLIAGGASKLVVIRVTSNEPVYVPPVP